MTVELRLIGKPDEVQQIEDAIRSVLKISGGRRYPSRRSDDELRYFKASAGKSEPKANVIRHLRRVDALDVRMDDIGGKNHVFIAMDFVAPGYVQQGIAASLNHEFQNSIRRIISSDVHDVWLRFDQSFKPPYCGLAVYHSGSDWMTVPYSGDYPLDDNLCDDDLWEGGDD